MKMEVDNHHYVIMFDFDVCSILDVLLQVNKK